MADEKQHIDANADAGGSRGAGDDGSDSRDATAGAGDSPVGDVTPARTRRSFVVGMAKRTAFIVPVVWTLTAQQAMAGASTPSSTPSCGAMGEPCVQDTDCCSDSCDNGFCT